MFLFLINKILIFVDVINKMIFLKLDIYIFAYIINFICTKLSKISKNSRLFIYSASSNNYILWNIHFLINVFIKLSILYIF